MELLLNTSQEIETQSQTFYQDAFSQQLWNDLKPKYKYFFDKILEIYFKLGLVAYTGGGVQFP